MLHWNEEGKLTNFADSVIFLNSSCISFSSLRTHSKSRYLTLSLEKAMAPHSSTLAWKIPWMEEPGRLQSMGSLRVEHDWATSLSLFTFMHWRRKWHPTPVFLPWESQGRGSLVGCRLWGLTESDTTDMTQQQQQQHYPELDNRMVHNSRKILITELPSSVKKLKK